MGRGKTERIPESKSKQITIAKGNTGSVNTVQNRTEESLTYPRGLLVYKALFSHAV